jgi:hypothetical protein
MTRPSTGSRKAETPSNDRGETGEEPEVLVWNGLVARPVEPSAADRNEAHAPAGFASATWISRTRRARARERLHTPPRSAGIGGG